MVQWDCDLLEFLMQVSVTDEFYPSPCGDGHG